MSTQTVIRHGRRAMLALLLASPLLPAGQDSENFNVTANVVDACSLSTINDLAFGQYDPLLGNNSTTTVTVTCSLLTPYSMVISTGSNSLTAAGRKMKHASATDTLSYTVSNLLAGAQWPDSGTTIAGTGTGLGVPTVIFGNLPASQNVQPGSYSDALTFTLNF
jgi:spore coat protein U-like protein